MSDEETVKIRRTFEDVEVAASGDGRTLEARIVPYNVPTMVKDPPDFQPYEEVWLPGAFDRQLNAANRVKVLMNFEHQQDIAGVIGHGTEIHDEPDGLHGTFRIHEDAAGDKALLLLREGILGGISLEAVPLKSNPPGRPRGGRVERVRAHLDKVALARDGIQAYQTAEVLAVRMEPVVIEQLVNDDLTTRIEALGWQPITRMDITRKPWDGSASRFTDEEYQRSCLIDRGGDASPKERCSLPVLEPNGDLNVNALGAAAARLNQTNASTAQKAAAARKLIRYYRMAQMTPPSGVQATAARS